MNGLAERKTGNGAVVVREATAEDAARMLEIYEAYVQHTAVTFEYKTPSLAQWQCRMRKIMARYPWLVAVKNGVVQGYAYADAFQDRAAYERSCALSIYLDEKARHCGMGRMLYNALEKALGAMGILNLYACIARAEEDDEYLTANSADFHAHLGFREVGEFRQCGYKFGRWYHMIWMEKMIGKHESTVRPVVAYPALRRGGETKR